MSDIDPSVRLANDGSVLLGLLALQLGLASRQQVEESLDAWKRDRTQSFTILLQQQSHLSPDQIAWLNDVAAAVLRQHQNDAAAGLAALGELLHFRSELSRRVDPEVTLDRPAKSAAGQQRATSSTAAAASATLAGRFQELKRHARGGMGEVFIADDREFDRKVALKRIRP